MKNYLRFLSPVMLLLMAVMFGGGKILAQKTVSLTLSSDAKFGQKSGSTLTQNGVTWKVTTNSGKIQNSYQTIYNGQQFGVKKTPWQGTFSTSNIVGNITKVAVAANTGGAANLSVKVGNTDFLSSEKSIVNVVKNSNGINTYTFEGNATGEIVVSLNGTKAACYLGSITVTYMEDDGKTETLTTSAGGYATYSADYAVNYSELGLTAYTITIDEGNNSVTAKEFMGVVPAGKAVLVKGTPKTQYTLTPATTEGDATFATALQTGATTADGTQYGFTSKSGTPAFAQVVSGQDIPAKKGYIVLKGASAAKYSICFDDEATGIQTIEAASAANGAMYNLAGQRVDKAYKGIVIVNGKKYLNK